MATTRAIYRLIDNHDMVAFDVALSHDIKDWEVMETFDLEEGDSFELHGNSGWKLCRNGRSYTACQVLQGEAGPLKLQFASLYRQHMAGELRRVTESTPDLALTPAEKSAIDRLIADLDPTDE